MTFQQCLKKQHSVSRKQQSVSRREQCVLRKQQGVSRKESMCLGRAGWDVPGYELARKNIKYKYA